MIATVFAALATLTAAYAPGLATRHPAGRAIATTSAAPITMLTESDRAAWCEDIEAAEKLSVVFFYAPWCRNCKAVRPKLQRIEKKFSDQAKFYQVNFKTETELCYQQRVFNFPTVHFYLPGIGRVARAVLTASNTDEKMRANLDRILAGQAQLKTITAEAIQPVVQYAELVGALQGLAELGGQESAELDASGFGAGLNVKKESARLRTMVESDERRLHELETLFRSLDSDLDGRLKLNELEGAVAALQPEGSASEMAGTLLSRLGGDSDAPISIDLQSFISLMVDKAVHDFAAGEKALMPAFEALDADADGTVSQQDLLGVIDNFCALRPDADGCEISERPLRLAQAFNAFANDEQLLDYERFVAMVSGRSDASADECGVGESAEERAARERTARYLAEEDELMGERECFGEAVIEDTDEDDIACDAWFFGEDPTVEKKAVVIDEERIAALKAQGEKMLAARADREAAMKALLGGEKFKTEWGAGNAKSEKTEPW